MLISINLKAKNSILKTCTLKTKQYNDDREDRGKVSKIQTPIYRKVYQTNVERKKVFLEHWVKKTSINL